MSVEAPSGEQYTSVLVVWVSHISHVSLTLHFLYALSIKCWVLVSCHIHHNCTLMWLKIPQGNPCPYQAKQTYICARRSVCCHLLKIRVRKFVLPRPQLSKRQSLLPPNWWYTQPPLNYYHLFSLTIFLLSFFMSNPLTLPWTLKAGGGKVYETITMSIKHETASLKYVFKFMRTSTV